MKKILVGFLAALSLTCAAAAAACAKEPEYFTLTYSTQAGVTYDFGEIKSGAEVKSGYTVSFTVSYDELLSGEPEVMLNGDKLDADGQGVYSFVMTQNSSVTVNGVWMADDYTVLFDAGEDRVWFYDTDGKDITGADNITYAGGATVSFKLKVSVYYGESKFQVSANTVVLQPENGVYSFTVLDNTTVSVNGLELDDGFIARDDGGSGTEDDPFIIKKPVDLYYMADLVGDDFYNGRFALAYYKMEADIDMQGEQVFVIGDKPTDDSISMFCGNFNGNGHKISNYYIKDSIIEQSGYTEVFLPYVGLFGYAMATTYGDVNIYGLTLDNFSIEINGANYLTNGFFAGGLVGFGLGVNIYDCSVNGEIIADGNTDYFSQVGGIIGYQQSVYASDEINYKSSVVSCSADVDIECALGNIFSAGGITGYLIAGEEKVNSYILNCSASGSVSGGIYTGGVVGYMGPYTSVVNCYSSGYDVYARSEVGLIQGNDIYAYAYGGGVAGYACNDTVIANSFALNSAASFSSLGPNYQKRGGVAGGFEEDGETYVQTKAVVLLNNYSKESKVDFNETFYKNTLGWKDADWNFTGKYPVPAAGTSQKNIKVTVNYLGGNTVSGKSSEEYALSSYDTVSELYKDVLPRFVDADGGKRSYGYYFDEAKKQAVPYPFIPSADITLYTDFADYSEVSGKYFVQSGKDGEVIELGADGTFVYRNGALNYATYYSYDGSTVILQSSPKFTDTVTAGGISSTVYICAEATAAGGILTVIDGVNYTQAKPLIAVRETQSFRYGSYYSPDSNYDYTFYKDGTGVFGTSAFTYTFGENKLKITLTTGAAAGNVIDATYADGKITEGDITFTAYDNFMGVWEKSATTHKQYAFDGKGGWTYSFYGYDSDGERTVIASQSGDYTLNPDGSITLSDGTRAGFNDEGFLNIVFDNYTEAYYRQNSFAGKWEFFNTKEAISITLNGIGENNYGTAKVLYGVSTTVYDMTYEVISVNSEAQIVIYLEDIEYGRLSFNAALGTLEGQMYSVLSGIVRDDVLFCLYDDFEGVWISTELGLVEFNGLGSYNLKGTSAYTKTNGLIKINGAAAGMYLLENSLMKGSFLYGRVNYEIEYDETTGTVKVTSSDGSFELIKTDEWYGLNLVSDGGEIYGFNGGGNLPDGGVLTLSSSVKKYNYLCGDGGVVIKDDGAEVGTLVLEDGKYKITLNGVTSVLTVSNPFTGTWLTGGQNGGEVVIGVINADDTAAGTYLGKQVTYVYDREGGYLSFETGGTKLYVTALKASSRTELAIGERPDTLGSYAVCMQAEYVDEVRGVYAAADGAKVELDGFSTSLFNKSKGTATVVDKDGKVSATYSYTVNKLGEIAFAGDRTYVFAESENGTYLKDGKKFEITETDYFYLRTISDSEGKGYTFNGHGTVTCGDEVYAYTVNDNDEVRREYYLTFTDKDGNKYDVVYDYGSSSAVLNITPAKA